MSNDVPFHNGPRVMKEYIAKFVEHDIDDKELQSSWGPILKVIKDQDGSSLKDISETLLIDKALVTRTVRILIEKGYVKNNLEDSRKYSLSLTEKGKEASEKLDKSMIKAWEYLFSDLDENECEVMKAVFTKVCNRIRGYSF